MARPFPDFYQQIFPPRNLESWHPLAFRNQYNRNKGNRNSKRNISITKWQESFGTEFPHGIVLSISNVSTKVIMSIEFDGMKIANLSCPDGVGKETLLSLAPHIAVLPSLESITYLRQLLRIFQSHKCCRLTTIWSKGALSGIQSEFEYWKRKIFVSWAPELVLMLWMLHNIFMNIYLLPESVFSLCDDNNCLILLFIDTNMDICL